MLRLAVVLLLLANAGYYAWSHGLLRSWGMAPAESGEPQRLAQQIAPEQLRLLPPEPSALQAAHTGAAPAGGSTTAAATPPASAPDAAPSQPAPPPAEPGACLEAGILDARQADAVRAAAAHLPQGSWSLEPTPIAGRWMVYMGKFPDQEAMARKRQELREMKIDTDRPGAGFEPGIALGRFSTEEAAQRGLSDLARKGVRTARVVQERSDAKGFMLRLPAVTAAQRPGLKPLQSALGGKPLRPCD